MRLRLLPLLLVLAALPAGAAERPTFRAAFDGTFTHLRIHKGTRDGLVNDYLGPKATAGVLRDAHEREVGSFVTIHADDFEAVVRVASFAAGRSLADVDHLAIPSLKLGFLPFTVEPSGLYFRIDKGRAQLSPDVLKRASKGRLFDADGRVAAIYAVVTVSESESLGYVTQFEQGFFAKDVVGGDITGFLD
ncbi:MAG: hypothetical protein KBB14_16705, partial [Thermoanaerobaculia bacterium]|nr:hypothetical protein [Thermoanaerobaculia bacterium]